MNDLDLSQRLAAPRPDLLGQPDLAAIRRRGTRRRRGRLAATVGGATLALAAVAGVGVTVGVGGLGGDSAVDRETTVYTPPPAPTELSPLAERVLREIPGAVRVSPGQVVIPGPGIPQQFEQEIDPGDIVAGPISLDAHTYTGVTAYPRRAFPGWLYEMVSRIEQGELAEEDGSYPVGSTEMGVLVDSGEAELACLASRTSSGEDMPGDACYPALVSTAGDRTVFEGGIGTDDFLEPGAEMELFTSEDYSDGLPSTVWIGGLDGTDVARVVLDLADGSKTDATVLSGTLVPGDTIFWADVPGGELRQVSAYDASGVLLDDHAIEPCSGGVDCEVR